MMFIRMLFSLNLFCFFICIFLISISSAQSIVINEIMSANQSAVFDQDGDSPDWIELYNNDNQKISLNGYTLSDDADTLNKWVFPDVSIEPYGTILVFASDKNMVTEIELHLNFKISSMGESLYLSDPMGLLIDQIEPVSLGEDESYGRLPDGASHLVHLEHYTPDQLNNNTSQLVFSKSSGFYGDSFYLKCQSFLEDTIYYSIDGSVPNLSSNIFNDSIFIYNKTSEPNYFSAFWTIAPNSLENYRDWSPTSTNVDKANIIRCVSYRDGKPSSRVYTQTYFVDENIHTKYDVPIISLVTDEKHLFDSDSGIYVPGVHFDDLQPEWTGNYFQKAGFNHRIEHRWSRS